MSQQIRGLIGKGSLTLVTTPWTMEPASLLVIPRNYPNTSRVVWHAFFSQTLIQVTPKSQQEFPVSMT